MYEHYIALDWAKSNMTLARMTEKSNKIKVIESPKIQTESDSLNLSTLFWTGFCL